MSLQSFFAHFEAVADEQVRPIWRYTEFETKLGIRREIRSLGESLIFLEVPPSGDLQFMAMHTKDLRVYEHGAHMLTLLANFYLERTDCLRLRLFGPAYQSVLALKGFTVVPGVASGNIESRDRRGNLADVELQYINSVTITKTKP